MNHDYISSKPVARAICSCPAIRNIKASKAVCIADWVKWLYFIEVI